MGLDRSHWRQPYTADELKEMNHAIDKLNLKDEIARLNRVVDEQSRRIAELEAKLVEQK